MQAGLAAYRQSRNKSMTRVDMLIALYAKTLHTISLMSQAVTEDDPTSYQLRQFEANRCVLALLDGIDPSQGEVAVNIQRLCHFALTKILEGSVEALEDAQKVLRPLHEAFVQIRDEAAELERKGEIPPLQIGAVYDEAML